MYKTITKTCIYATFNIYIIIIQSITFELFKIYIPILGIYWYSKMSYLKIQFLYEPANLDYLFENQREMNAILHFLYLNVLDVKVLAIRVSMSYPQ